MILFFETYSIIQTLLLFKYIRKAGVIDFHKRSFPHLKYNPRTKKIVERIIRLFNMNVRIETLPAERINEHNWIMNKRAVDVVEKITPDIENSSIYKTILKIIKDENILKSYKMHMTDSVSARLLFFRIARDLCEDKRNKTYLVPADNDNSRIQKELFGSDILNSYILKGSITANKLREFLQKVRALVIFLLLPSAYIILNIKKFALKKIDKKSYDIAMPVIWGFHEGDVMIGGVKWQQDEGYLYNEKITPGRIIHIFGFWRRTPDVEKSYKKTMEKRGIPYIDKKDYKITTKLLLIAVKMQFKIIYQFLINFLYWRDRYEYIWCSILIINWMLKKYLEFENVDYKVELMRHDYSPNHIVETIICNKNNKKTIGIQHGNTCGQYVMPSLCYVHFNKYCIFSERHLELHSPFWNELNLEKIGNYRVDHLLEISNNPSWMASTKNRVIMLYGDKRHIVLILFPSPSEYNLMERWNEIYDALCELKTIEIDCNVFLRFRDSKHLENSHLKRFKELRNKDSRLITDLTNFTTYELMGVSDLVISNSHSSGMIDAVAMNKRAFTFDYMGTAKYCFGKYGKDLILTRKEDVLNLFKNIENNFSGYDCNWELMRKEYNYYYDGRCLERLQKVILETVEEVKENAKGTLKGESFQCQPPVQSVIG